MFCHIARLQKNPAPFFGKIVMKGFMQCPVFQKSGYAKSTIDYVRKKYNLPFAFLFSVVLVCYKKI